jgi:hypothetical protein
MKMYYDDFDNNVLLSDSSNREKRVKYYTTMGLDRLQINLVAQLKRFNSYQDFWWQH